jgi:hypothetical protein
MKLGLDSVAAQVDHIADVKAAVDRRFEPC